MKPKLLVSARARMATRSFEDGRSRLLDTDEPFFSLKLKYEGDTLVLAQLNGKRLEVGK